MRTQREKRSTCGIAAIRTMTAAVLAIVVIGVAISARAQSFSVLHTFGGVDGDNPQSGLAMDRAGNLYGTTYYGGSAYQGNVFRLTHKNSAWIYTSLYSFQGGTDGGNPEGGVVVGSDGSLYGTTNQGGDLQCGGYGTGCGTIFRLQPPARACASAQCSWTETVLYRFDGSNEAGFPVGGLAFDRQGDIYGSAGEVYELSRSNGGWTMTIPSSDYYSPSGVILDSAGNIYGAEDNLIFELSPSPSGWMPTILHQLSNGTDGYDPIGLIFDQAGNLYGANFNGGPNGGGTVFELSPSNGSWTYSVLYAFTGQGFGGPLFGSLLMDPAGSLYGGALYDGAHGVGSIFRLTPSDGGWAYTDLHDFHSLGSDGCYPQNPLVRDASGNLYGTTSNCGSGNPGEGTVFEITP